MNRLTRLRNLISQLTATHRPPTFLVIGAQKAGTSSLWAYLRQHPQIEMADPKELQYFNRRRRYPNHLWYRGHFRGDRLASGEVTPNYCYWPGAIERIHRFDPSLKLIMVMRNPIDRAISHYWMEVQRGDEPLPIRQAFDAEEDRLRTGDPFHLRRHSYLARGRYHEQLDRVFALFDASQVLLLKSEELAANTHQTLDTIMAFLGADGYSFAVDQKHRVGSYDPPDKVLRMYLAEYFAPHNQRLTEKYGIPTDDWA